MTTKKPNEANEPAKFKMSLHRSRVIRRNCRDVRAGLVKEYSRDGTEAGCTFTQLLLIGGIVAAVGVVDTWEWRAKMEGSPLPQAHLAYTNSIKNGLTRLADTAGVGGGKHRGRAVRREVDSDGDELSRYLADKVNAQGEG